MAAKVIPPFSVLREGKGGLVRLSVGERRAVAAVMARRYGKATKGDKARGWWPS